MGLLDDIKAELSFFGGFGLLRSAISAGHAKRAALQDEDATV